MTITEFLQMPKGMTIEEWQSELDKQKKQANKLRRIQEKIYDCEDALDVLADEKGSERYINWQDKLKKYQAQYKELQKIR